MQRIRFIRICELSVGQMFLHEGLWRRVSSIKSGVLTFSAPKPERSRKNAQENYRTVSAGSKQFVQVND